MSLQLFFDDIFLKKESIKDILDLYPHANVKGSIFERCADLLIKLGFFSKFSNIEFKHVIGNINEGTISFLDAQKLKKYIKEKQAISGKGTGISDITLYNELENKYIFISSKYYSTPTSVKDYDIADIKAMIDHNKHIYKNYEIYLLVNDKNDLIEKASNADSSSHYITKYIDIEKIIDINDLEKAFFEMKNYYLKDSNIFKNFILDKKILIPKFHQKLFEIKFFKQKALDKKIFLLGLKPRAGKTFIVGMIISKDKNNYENFNILVITPAPNETSSQFLEMFENYIDFNDFNIINLNSGAMIENLNFTNKNIIVTSKQLLQNYINNDGIISIKNLNLNYLFFDENHYGGTTQLSTSIVDTYKNENTNLVFLTATFQKSLNHWCILEQCSFYWELEDENLCKNKNVESLINKHGNEVLEALDYFAPTDTDILKNYENMPNLELLTTMFEPTIFKNIKEKVMQNGNKFGFSAKTLFSITNSNFNYEYEIELFLRFISGSEKEIDFPDGDKSIFGRIKEISLKKGSRTLLSNSNFTTQLWFLPFGIEQKINDVSQLLKILMLKNKILNKFEILILNSNTETPIKDIKREIKKRELIGKEEGKKGLIVLVGNQCSLGITLELCDIVLLLNDILSADKIYQMMYRSMTEAPNKKCGFVVDLNINRVLNTFIEYSLYNKDLSIENKIKYIIENNLLNIDSDYLLNKKIDETGLINNLLEIWKKDPINNVRKLLKNIEYEIIEINNNDQNKLNNIFTKSFNGNNNIQVNFFEDGDEQELQSGKIIKKEKISNKDPSDLSSLSDEEDGDNKDNEENISLTKDVLPFVIPLICFLTIKENNKNFLEMLVMIKNNEELLEIFNDQTFLWWNKTNILDMINYFIKKYIKENSNIFNITIIIKMTLQSLIDKPDELLVFINDCLKPKKVEQHKFGEVFTPMPLINEMLDKLPTEVWSNPELKWLDLANGMGNFMIAIYFKLMEGLKNSIHDDEERKKHILENMFYMSEINKKNCFITKQIFDVNNKYKLNIYNGDSLLLECETEWQISKFDIIVGNPPYQAVSEKGVVKGGGNNLYTKFIYKSDNLLKDGGFLLYITPPTFFSVGRSNNKDNMNIRKDIFNNYFIHCMNIQECAKYFNVGSDFIYYLIQKKNELNPYLKVLCKYKKNIFNSTINQELFNNADFLPYLFTNESLNICNKIKLKENKLTIFHSPDNRSDKKHIKKTKYDEYIYPMQATGTQVVYSSKECKNQYDKKVLMSRSGYLKPFYDDGVIGVGGDCFCILVKDEIEANYIIKLLNSNLYKFFIDINKWSGFHHLDVLQTLSYFNNEDLSDENLYKLFDLIEEEILLVDGFYQNKDDNDTKSTSSNSKSSSSNSKKSKSKKSDENVVLCGAPLKKKGNTCKNKASEGCNGKCKRHCVTII